MDNRQFVTNLFRYQHAEGCQNRTRFGEIIAKIKLCILRHMGGYIHTHIIALHTCIYTCIIHKRNCKNKMHL